MQEILQVTVPPATTPVTLAQAKLQCRVDASMTTEDALLTSLIWTATEYAEARLKMALVNRTYQWSFDYFPNRIVLANGLTIGNNWLNSRLYPYTQAQILYLPKPPLISVTNITYVDSDGNQQTMAPGSFQAPGTGNGLPVIPGRVAPLPGQIWAATKDVLCAVSVTYVAGFGYQEDDVTPNVPYRIQQAILMVVAELYKNREVSSEVTLSALPVGLKNLFDSAAWGFYS